MIVEVSIKLVHDLAFYDDLLKSNGFINDNNVKTHDIYYTNEDLEGKTEEEMKNACIRLRSCNDSPFQVQNNLLGDSLEFKEVNTLELEEFENKLLEFNYRKVFDTLKYDHQYIKDGMTNKIQLQEINDIGLLLYYDNSKVYHLEQEKQRKSLIDELVSYGFKEITYDSKDLDKLRTLFYKKDEFSGK